MPRNRALLAIVIVSLGCLAAVAPLAAAANGIGPAVALGGSTKLSVKADATTTSAKTAGREGSKEELALVTQSPAAGATLGGKVIWQVTATAGSPTKVEFAVDGVAKWTQTSSPFAFGGSGGTLDTTELTNGTHTLTATAYGNRGVKATTKVTVTVKNAPPVEEPIPTPTPEPEPLPETGTGGPVYWGATIGSQITGNAAPWDMNAVTKFEETTRRPMSLIEFFSPFSNCSGGSCSFYSFPWTPLENIRQHGSIPVLSWSSESIPAAVAEPDYQLSDIISGRYDSYIRSFAAKAKQWGHPFFLRFDWEMNGNWFPWSEGVNGNKNGEYIAAWRHVHDIFAEVGATNVTWVWCPNIESNHSTSYSSVSNMYPGNEYVDWIGLDGYNWGTNPANPDKWRTFDELYRSSYRYLVETVAPSKPLMVAEVASTEYGGSKSTWIREMLHDVPSEFPNIRAVIWFDKFDSGMDWPIETSTSATEAFSEGIQSPDYLSNLYSALSVPSILPAT